MIHPWRMAFDIDGVFADTMELFLQIARRDYGIDHVRYADITRYYLEECLDIDPDIITTILTKILEGHFDSQLKPIPESCAVLSAMAREGPLLFVTARPVDSPIKEWVCRMLPRLSYPSEVIATGNFEAKADVLKERGITHFVEDCLDVCFRINQEGVVPIVFRQPWNRYPHPFQEVRTWAEIGKLVAFGWS